MGALATQPATALEAFLRQEALRPSTTYLVQPLPDGSVQRLTWAEVGEQARRVAGYLDSLQLPAGSCIGLLARNCAHWIIADLAIWMAGHVSVPLHPGLTVDFISQVARHADLRAVFLGRLEGWPAQRAGLLDEVVRLALPQGPEERGVVPWSALQQQAPLEPQQPVADQPATIIYTSGTTGVPKGVVLSFASMYLAASNFLRLFTISASDRMLSCQSFSHIGERQFVEMTSLLGGQQVFFVERAASFLEDCRRARPTLFIASPRVWQDCMDACDRRWPARWLQTLLSLPVLGPLQGRRALAYLGLDQVRYAVSGAARLNPALQRRFAALGLQVVEAYGMTENCGYSHLGRPSRQRPGYIGLPNPGVECRLGPQGELLVRSKTLMLGYHKDPVRTAEVLDEDGFLHTGDAAEIDQEGFLRLLCHPGPHRAAADGRRVDRGGLRGRTGSTSAAGSGPAGPRADSRQDQPWSSAGAVRFGQSDVAGDRAPGLPGHCAKRLGYRRRVSHANAEAAPQCGGGNLSRPFPVLAGQRQEHCFGGE